MKALRLERINAELRELISNIIQNELNDPRINGIISVLKVDVDNELYMADTYISIYNAKNEEDTLNALQSSAGYIRKLLSKQMKLRTVPNIKFKLDKNLEYSEKIESILSKLDIPSDDETENN